MKHCNSLLKSSAVVYIWLDHLINRWVFFRKKNRTTCRQESLVGSRQMASGAPWPILPTYKTRIEDLAFWKSLYIAILLEAFFSLKTQNRSACRALPSLLEMLLFASWYIWSRSHALYKFLFRHFCWDYIIYYIYGIVMVINFISADVFMQLLLNHSTSNGMVEVEGPTKQVNAPSFFFF